MRVFPFQQLGEAVLAWEWITDLLVGNNCGDLWPDYYSTELAIVFDFLSFSFSCSGFSSWSATVQRGFHCIFHIKWWYIIIYRDLSIFFWQFCIIFDLFPAGSWPTKRGQWNCVALWRVWKIPQDPQQRLGAIRGFTTGWIVDLDWFSWFINIHHGE